MLARIGLIIINFERLDIFITLGKLFFHGKIQFIILLLKLSVYHISVSI